MSLRHPNIVTFIGTCVESNIYYVVTEYMEKRSLKNVLENKNYDLTTYDKLKFCLDIAIAVNYLHTRKPQVFHRDLKSSNCLVDSRNRIKLCDFGLSKTYEEYCSKRVNAYETNTVSTCYWMAPEFLKDNLFSDKADVYAYGVLCWEIMMRDTIPYKNIPEVTFLCADPEVLKMRPQIPDDFDFDIRALIERCWDGDYKMRPDFNSVIKELENLIKIYQPK
jgi:serine/threonine protein kinase